MADQLVTARDVIYRMKTCGLNIDDFVLAVVEGEITPVKNLPWRGLSGFAFSKNQITAFLYIRRLTESKKVVDFGCVARFLDEKWKQNEMMFTKSKKDRRGFMRNYLEIYDLLSLVHIAKS